jgi:hypothetical protein
LFLYFTGIKSKIRIITPNAIERLCWYPQATNPLPRKPNNSPNKAYEIILPELYKILPLKKIKFEDFGTGKASAIGPHIPMQWKLPIKPIVSAVSNSI